MKTIFFIEKGIRFENGKVWGVIVDQVILW